MDNSGNVFLMKSLTAAEEHQKAEEINSLRNRAVYLMAFLGGHPHGAAKNRFGRQGGGRVYAAIIRVLNDDKCLDIWRGREHAGDKLGTMLKLKISLSKQDRLAKASEIAPKCYARLHPESAPAHC